MAKLHRISVGDKCFSARSGQVLLDAALMGGVDLPHDCRAGRCGSCLTRVQAGITMGGQTRQPGMIHACQAMVFSDLSLEIESLPPVVRTKGRISKLEPVGDDIVEVTIEPSSPIDILRGQYCRFRFRGFPERPFSPTAPLSDIGDSAQIHLHIKKVRDGRVTPFLGDTIKAGHAVTIEGPLGHAFLRPDQRNRLVLVGSGTGFAPIWAVAAAALRENPDRRIILIAAARKLQGFYMSPALNLARNFSGTSIVGCVEELGRRQRPFVSGRPTDHLPELNSDDIVYAAGSPAMVDAIGSQASNAGATFHADPFEPTAPRAPNWMDKARAWLDAG